MTIEQLRKYKILDIALFDLVLGVIGLTIIFLLAWKFHFENLDWWKFVLAAILLTIPVGIVFHILFGINTSLNYKLGLSNAP